MGKKGVITADRLNSVAAAAAKTALKPLGEELKTPLPESLLSCAYVGTVEDHWAVTGRAPR